MPAAGKTVTLPLVSSVPVNACVHFFNVGPQVTIGTQGNDGTQIRTLNTGDWAAYIADGGSFWHVAERGRMFPDEIVGGRLTVGGEVIANAQNAFRAAQGDYGAILRNDGQNVYLLQTKKGGLARRVERLPPVFVGPVRRLRKNRYDRRWLRNWVASNVVEWSRSVGQRQFRSRQKAQRHRSDRWRCAGSGQCRRDHYNVELHGFPTGK
ncbi:hypothetical protein [Burkholderia cenocepacia]|uniref:phage tail fiber protein n=1 Tax=Burkholderia cenocepacia TaxID=95486 RepID=UPI003D16233E